jgi:Ca2+-binding RTX toxin-like protein
MRSGVELRGPRHRWLLVVVLVSLQATFGSGLARADDLGAVFSDGFESGTLANWTITQNLVVQSGTVATGAFAARASVVSGSGYGLKTLPSTFTDLKIDQAVFIASIGPGSTVNLARLRSTAVTNIVTVFVGGDGLLRLRNDATGTVINSTRQVALGTWHRLEVSLVVAGVASAVQTTFDGTPVAQLSGTMNLGTDAIAQFILGDNVAGRTYDVSYDDIVLTTAMPPPPPPSGACSFDEATHVATVTITTSGQSERVSVASGGGISVSGSICGGATVTNTDRVDIRDRSSGSTTAVIDLSGGPFVPGSNGDEIRFDVDLGTGTSDSVVLQGGPGSDTFTLGSEGANLNVGPEAAPDVVVVGVEAWTLSGEDGNDVVSAIGGSGTGAAFGQRTTLQGGNGEDVLVGGDGLDTFDGGAAVDTVNYSARAANLSVTVGDGLANDGQIGETDNVTGTVERVIGGSGDDAMSGDDSSERLDGGAGNDTLNGENGDDEIRGGSGNDVLNGGGGDDMLVGGPGDDQENGQALNDVFIQANQVIHQSTDVPKALPVASTVTSTITISGAPSKAYNVDMWVDIQDPATGSLYISLETPSGIRDVMFDRTSNGTQLTGTYFDSEAVTKINLAGSKDLSGRFHPQGSMETFNGQVANGTWSLLVSNLSGGSPGVLAGWGLQITYLTNVSDGNDRLSGGVGILDLVNYQGRSANLNVTMMTGVNDGQAGETDDVGASQADVEDCYLGNGNDSLTGTGSINDLRGGTGNDTISGLAGDDLIRGQDLNDSLFGGDGNDTIQGNGGTNTIDGGPGSDWMTYAGSGSGVTANLSTGSATSAAFIDTIVSVENLTGSSRNDSLTGDGGNNVINAGNGDDFLWGLAGSDTLNGGGGFDTIDGGPGNDACSNGESLTSCP